jgi:hypothetical protein
LGARLRYDLQQALTGHCALAETCAQVAPGLTVMSALRAVDQACAEPQSSVLATTLEQLMPAYRRVLVLLPASRLSTARRVLPMSCALECLLVMASGATDVRAAMSLIAQAARAGGIEEFQVLFPGLDVDSAGRLSTAMSTLVMRHFGARLTAAPVSPAWRDTTVPYPGYRPLENVC